MISKLFGHFFFSKNWSKGKIMVMVMVMVIFPAVAGEGIKTGSTFNNFIAKINYNWYFVEKYVKIWKLLI